MRSHRRTEKTRKEEGIFRREDKIKEERGTTTEEPTAKLSMHDDNTAMIQVCRSARNNQMNSIGRTFGVSIRSLHEATQRDDFELGPIRSKDMVADIHTKAYPEARASEWQNVSSSAGIVSPDEGSRNGWIARAWMEQSL